MPLDEPVRAIAGGGRFSVVAGRDSGAVFTWGDGRSGCLAHGTYDGRSSDIPGRVARLGALGHCLDGVMSVAAGQEHVLALHMGGEVSSWGSWRAARSGQLGREIEAAASTSPFLPPHPAMVVVDTGTAAAAGTTAGGYSSSGSGPVRADLANHPRSSLVPGRVSCSPPQQCSPHTGTMNSGGGGGSSSSSSSRSSGGAGTQDRGDNDDDGDHDDDDEDQDQDRPLRNVIQIACGAQHSAALTWAGHLLTWGEGTRCRLGLGNDQSAAFPLRVGGPLIGKFAPVRR